MRDRTDLTRGERRLLDWLERFDFNGNGCYPTRAELAERCGYREEYVSALVKGLRAKGYITVKKRRAPGAQYAHNFYIVHDWNPHVRRGICNLRADFQRRKHEAENPSSYLDRTAKPSRAHTPPVTPRPHCLEHQRCGRARETHQKLARRRRMCDCRDCNEQIGRITEELSGALHTIRKLGAENSRLRGATPHAGPMDPKQANVWMIVENWLWLCRGRKRSDGKGRLPLIDPGSKRWRLAQAALNREPEGLLACIEAVEGLAAKPYVSAHGRQPHGRPSQRYDDIEYALKDETTVERCRRYRAEVIGATESVLFHAWQACTATDHLYFTLWTGKRARDAFDRLPEHKQIAHRMRVAEAADAEAEDTRARVIEITSRRRVA